MGRDSDALAEALGRVLELALDREKQLVAERRAREVAAHRLGTSVARALKLLRSPPEPEERGLEEALEALDSVKLGSLEEVRLAVASFGAAMLAYRKQAQREKRQALRRPKEPKPLVR